jgi:uncharacterized damage-inducible protein DinB
VSNVRSNSAVPQDRSWPTSTATDELRLYWEFLTFLRVTAVNKVAGLSREQAVATPWPTSPTMSALGVLKHLTAVERWWLSIVGGDVDLPPLWASEDAQAEWRIGELEDPASVVAAYRAEWALSEQALAGLAASDPTRRRVANQEFTVRWVLAHVVQETARHVGHLDVLRELADGTVGE